MRTSKKLLSFFLAVVMVVTTCSVGFTAFAKSNDNPLWQTTGVDADSAFNTLNTLADNLPSLLMGIDVISNAVYEKGAKKLGKKVEDLTDAEKEQIKSETTLQDLLGVLQPTLIGALASTSQSDFVRNIYGDTSHNLSNYNYLSGSTGSIDYYSLAALCYNYKDNSGLSKESRDQLEEWLYGAKDNRELTGRDATGKTVKYSADSLWYLATLYNQQASSDEEIIAKLDAIGKRYNQAFTDQKIFNLSLDGSTFIGSTYETASLYQLKQCDYQLTSDDQAIVDERIAAYNKMMDVYNIGIHVTDVAELLYYGFGMGQYAVNASFYIKLIQDGGLDLNAEVETSGVTGTPLAMNGFKINANENNLSERVEAAICDSIGVSNIASAIKMMMGMSEDDPIDDATLYTLSNFLVDSVINADLLSTALLGGTINAYTSPYYVYMLKGLAVNYGNDNGVSLDEINAAIDAQFPHGYNKDWKDGDAFFISDEELEQLHDLINNIGWDNVLDKDGTGHKYVTDLFEGSVTFTDTNGDGKKKTVKIPDSLKGTGVLDFWYHISNLYSRANIDSGSSTLKGNNYVALAKAFAGDYPNNPVQFSATEYTSSNSLVDYSASDEGTGISKATNSKVSYSKADIQKWADNSYNYIVTKTVSKYLGLDTSDLGTSKSDTYMYDETYAMFDLVDIDGVFSKIIAQKTAVQTDVVLTDDQKAILNGDNTDLTDSVGTEIVNLILNNTIGDIVDPDTSIGSVVDSVLKSLLKTNVNLQAVLTDIWSNLVNDPIKTVVNLLPVLAVLVNELVEPMLFAEVGDAQRPTNDGFIYTLLGDGLLETMNAKSGSYIGIDQLAWDLNELLPNLMHWLKADGSYTGSYWNDGNAKSGYLSYFGNGGYETKDYTANEIISDTNLVLKYDGVADKNGRELTYTDNGDGTYTYSYNGNTADNLTDVLANIPNSTRFNVKYSYEAGVPRLTGIYIVDKALKYAKISDLEDILKNAITTSDGQIGKGLYEVIDELANMFTTALDTYVSTPELRNQEKGRTADTDTVINRGLNNITVALPQLFDIMENLGAEKYGIKENAWTYCYDGKIVNENGAVSNAKMTEFKDFAANPDPVKIFDSFAKIFVEDWLDAILSLVNNVISVKNSEFTKNLPIVTGLLNSVGGFSENSALTDLFNSIFQITRESDYSFTFEKQSSGFVGLDKDNAYFLITNVSKLVDVIKALVESIKNSSNDGSDTASLSSIASKAIAANADASAANDTPMSSVDLSNYTNDEIGTVDKTIANLDSMLSSLLVDSSINGYNLSKTSNIVTGVISLLSNYIGADASNQVIDLLNTYLYYLNGEDQRSADSDGNVDPKDIYTNEGLTTVVVRTFALVETLVANLTDKYAYTYTYKDNGDDKEAKYNLISEAVNGLISPDSLAVRIKETDFGGASKQIKKLASWNDAIESDGTINVDINWGITKGDRDEFLNAFSASIRILTSIAGVILLDTGIYENALYPALNAIAQQTGIKIDTPSELADASNEYRDELVKGLVNPLVSWLDTLLQKPATTLINTIIGLSAVLDDTNTSAGTVASIVSGAVTPVQNELNGAANLLKLEGGKLGALSPTLASLLEKVSSDTFDQLTKVNGNQELGLKINDVALSGNNIIPIVNTLLAQFNIKLNNINWNFVSKCSQGKAVIYVLEYLVDTVLSNDNLAAIASLIGDNETINTIVSAIQSGKVDAHALLKVLNKVLNLTQNPTLFAWSFEQYLTEAAEGFTYPQGITKAQANEAANDIDAVINNIFPVLASLGLDLGGNNLKDILSSNVFKNDLITTIVKAIYGGISSNETVANVFSSLGVASTPAAVAALLTDASYGKTFSDAANAIAGAASWNDVANVNWGFTDGAANAQQGFVNALVAALRPLFPVVSVLLNEGSAELGTAVYEILKTLDSESETLTFKNGVLTITVKDANNADSKDSVIKIDIKAVKQLMLYGTNAYNSAIIPLLEALGANGIKTDAQYKSDIAAAKDNLLLDILNPILGADNSILNDIVANPLETICTMLPNLAVYIDANGLSQFVANLIAPITQVIYGLSDVLDVNSVLSYVLGYYVDNGSFDGLNADDVVAVIAGTKTVKPLGDVIAGLIGMGEGKLTVDLSDLSTLNLQDAVVPALNTLLASLIGDSATITLADIDWNLLASLGDRVTYTSKATDTNGNALTGKKLENVDYGKTLITVLRYVIDTAKNNIDAINTLLSSIDAINSNSTISGIVTNVVTQIKTHSTDEIITAIYYFFVGNNTSAYWDYTGYKSQADTFTFPSGVTERSIATLINLIDNVISGIDLNSLLNSYLYTDSLINTLAKAIYTNIESVKISDTVSLGDILDLLNINVTANTFADLLVNSAYGETNQFKSASEAIKSAGKWSAVNFDNLTWGVKDQETFLNALVAVLRPLYGVLDTVVADGQLSLLEGVTVPGSNGYVNSIVPLLEALGCENIVSYEQYLNDKNNAYDNLLLDILNPLFGFVNKVVANPINTVAKAIPNIALFIGNNGITQLAVNLITPITAIVRAINPIIDVDALLNTLLGDLLGGETISVVNLGDFLGKYVNGDKIVGTINSLLSSTGLALPEINWIELASLGTTNKANSAVEVIGDRLVVDANVSEVLVYLLNYLIETVTTSNNLEALKNLINNDTASTLLDAIANGKLDISKIITLIDKVASMTTDPTLLAWSFENYLTQAIEGFYYPQGMTKAQADEAAADIDLVINNIFPLLKTLGLDLGASDLSGILNANLFTNEIITKLVFSIYGAISSNETVATVLKGLGVVSSPADVAAILTDASYGATFTDAANFIASAPTWDALVKTDVKNKCDCGEANCTAGSTTTKTYPTINWGFKDGAANAQQGFTNALVAALRPMLGLVSVFFNENNIEIGNAVSTILSSVDLGDKVKIENNILTADLGGSALTVDLSVLSDLKLLGTNGYNSAVIPLLEALGAKNIKTYAEYKADVAAAKDNILLDVLNPIMGSDNSVLSQILAKPLEAICELLPNLAVFFDAEGLSQFLNNLLAPVTQLLSTVTDIVDVNAVLAEVLDYLFANNTLTGINADNIVNAIVGNSNKNLGNVIASKLGMAEGSLNVDLNNISAINVSDAVVPIINLILSDPSIIKASEKSTTSCPCSSSKCPDKLTNEQIEANKKANETNKKIIGYVHQIKIGNIDWNLLASLGNRVTYTSKATDLNGNALTGKKLENVDAGKTLITVLRYVLNTVKNNINPLSSILTSIDQIASNDTLKAIVNNVITQIKTHSADQIIVGLYYFFVGEATDAYWNFTDYKTKNSTFKFPKGVKASDVAALVTFLDGIIDEVDLNALLNQYLYTDSLVNTLAKLIYTNIEKTKISDSITLGDILSILDINVSSNKVADLLVNAKYGETKQFATASETIKKAGSWAKVDFDKLSWGVKDQKTFLNALVAILRPFYGVLDAIVADGSLAILEGVTIPGSNGYENSIVPLLEAFGCENIASYKQYKKDIDKAYDNLLLDVLNPLFGFVDSVVSSPLETIAQALPNVALFIGNDGITQLVVNLITPVTQVIKAVAPVIDVDALLYDLTKVELNGKKISVTKLGDFIGQYTNGGQLIATVNSFLTTTGISIPEIDWLGLASLGKTSKADSAVKVIGDRLVVKADTSKVIVAVLRYVLNAVLSNADAIKGLLGDSYKGILKEILDLIFGMNADDLLALVFGLVNITQSPTEVFWSYKEYKQQMSKFKYPDGITAKDAENAVSQLDGAVDGVMALLNSFGVISSSNLQGVVSDLLFTNDIVTKLASGLYGALDTDKVKPYISMVGIDVTPKGVAKLLTDKSYGKTFNSAAKTLKSAKSWKKVTTVNWGFKDGAANAQQGFVNAVVAVLRPFTDIIAPFLNGENLELGNILYGVVTGLDIKSGDKKKGETLVTLKKGKLTIKTQKDGVYSTAFALNLSNLKTLKTLNLYGSNGYENSIIPLLDVLQVDNSQIKSFDQYVKDCKKAKDNALLDVINPLMSFVSKVLDKPFDTLTSVLPNLAYFIDNGGVGQLLDNLLSPVTVFLKNAKKQGVDIDKIIKLVAGKDLGSLLTGLLKLNGVKLKVSLTNLKACNIADVVYPLITSLLKKTGIVLPYFDFATIASHGTVTTSKSKAENAEGKYTNKEVIADKGEVLVAVLRYISDTLIKNAKSLKALLTNIDAIKKNDMLKSIITSVFNTIGIAEKDDIVRAVFYLLNSTPKNAFWDYTAYKTGTFDFSYPEGMDTDFLKNLPPMLDGLVGGLLDLNATIGGLIFKDDIITSLATGLYGAIEGVKVGDGSLISILAQTGIDFSTKNVAKLLTDEAYGQTYTSQAQIISAAGSWSKVNKDALKWGVKDADSFFHALAAVLRPIYGVLDVLLNDAYLGLFNIVRIPGSNGYTSSIVPLMEAFSMYNVKTQYQYREDIKEAYDNILLDIINPLWDKVEDILSAPLETLFAMLPNLALFIGNDGLCQIIDNLLTPVSALVDAIKPVVNLNDLLTAVLSALNVDLGSLLGKIGISNFSLDLYDLNATLKPILGGDAIIPLVNNILGLIKIGGTPLGLKLNDVNWLQLASHGKTVVSASQAATYGARIYVDGDSSETLIAVLRYLIETVNAGDNFDKINDLIGGLLGDSANATVSDVVNQVLGMLQGDTDQVISDLVDLLQTLA